VSSELVRGIIAFMAYDTPPQIERRYACIATNANVVLAAVISSYFQETGVYFPVFEFPSIDTPHLPSIEFGKDGYFGRVIGSRAAGHINNALARIQPQSILLLGLTDTEKTYLHALLPLEMLVHIDTIEDVPKLLPFTISDKESISCKSHQVIEGLLHAKFARKHLIVDDSAPELPTKYLHGGEGVLIIENSRNVDDVAAINCAFAINSDVVLVPPVDRDQIRSLPQQLRAWSNDHSHHAYEDIKRPISKRIRGIDFLQYKFATCFTVGLPYGLIINNIIPCSHVLKEVDCGVFIANNLVEEHFPMTFDSALLFSPRRFPLEETDDILRKLNDSNYTVKLLVDKDATVKQLDNYGSYFPFDVMHICSHGGETSGYFVTQEFVDREGNPHKCEFYEVVGFAPTDVQHVMVTRKMIFKTFDGFPWMSRPLKSIPHYVFEDMMKVLKSKSPGRLVRVRVTSPIALSCHIECHDSIHQGAFQSLSGVSHPFVFNNTCASSHELAATFIAAGARSYLGTLWSVGNKTASCAATDFYEEAIRQGNLLAAFFAMNGRISNKKYQNVYILWGLHFSSLRKPSEKSDAKIFHALIADYFEHLEKFQTTPDVEVKRTTLRIAAFLSQEITRNFSRHRLDEIANFDPKAVEDFERTQSTLAEDGFGQGVNEVEVISQEDTINELSN
jgi:hypothetical protein